MDDMISRQAANDAFDHWRNTIEQWSETSNALKESMELNKQFLENLEEGEHKNVNANT